MNENSWASEIDLLFLTLAVLSVPLWLVVKQPVLSIVLLTTTGMLGFAPTIRKTWKNPHSETLAFYVITTFRHTLSIAALSEYNIVTILSPATWALANAGFTVMLVLKRRVSAV